MITKEMAIELGNRGYGELHHKTLKNADGKTPVRVRVNGKCKTWKTRPEQFTLPVKHGLNCFFYITEANANEWKLAE